MEKVINIIKYVKTSGKSYSGNHIDIGYHSIELDGVYHRGQRDCVKRLEYCKKEFPFMKLCKKLGCKRKDLDSDSESSKK